MQIFDELKTRGVEDVLFICMDGVSSLEDGAKAIFKDVVVQRCIVHLIRNSIKYVPSKDYKKFTQSIKKVYGAPSLTASIDKAILKIILFPLLLVIMFLHLLVKLATNLSSFVIGFFMLFFIGCGIYNVVQAQWLNVALITGMAFITFVLAFMIVWIEMMVERAVDFISDFYF